MGRLARKKTTGAPLYNWPNKMKRRKQKEKENEKNEVNENMCGETSQTNKIFLTHDETFFVC